MPGGERLPIGAGAEQSVAGIELIVKGKINCVSPLRTTDRGCRNPEIGNRPRYIDRRVGRDARWPGGGDHFQFRPAAQRDDERPRTQRVVGPVGRVNGAARVRDHNDGVHSLDLGR